MKLVRQLDRLIVPLALLGAWWLASRAGMLSPHILPAPGIVWDAFLDLVADGSLLVHLGASLRRVALGFAAGTAFGLATAALAGAWRPFRAYVQPVLDATTQVNAMAWLPLVSAFLGIDEGMKIVVIGWSASVPISLGTLRGIDRVPAPYRELARVLSFTRTDALRLVVLPSVLPAIFTGLREGLANAWQALVIVELYASFEGLGYLMAWGRQLFQLELVLVGMILIALVGFALNGAMRLAERRLFPALAEAAG
jgi:sulfonate transport system permease protein